MKCPNCNNEIPDGIKFCGKCGKAVEIASTGKANEMPDKVEETDSPERKAKTNKLMIIIPAVALALVLIIVGTLMGGKLIKDKKTLELYKTAEDKINSEDYDGALATYEEILGTNDKDSQVYMKMADAYMAQDKLDKCKEILDRGYQATSDGQLVARKKELILKAASARGEDGDHEGALSLYNELIALEPSNEEYYSGAVDTCLDMKRYDDAILILEKMQEACNPGNATNKKKSVITNIAKAFYDEKDYVNAIKYYKELIDADPKDANSYIALYVTYIGQGNLGEADKILEEGYKNTNSGELEAKKKEMTEYIQGMYAANGDFENALSYSLKLIDMDKSNPEYYKKACDAYIGLGKYDDAIGVYDNYYNETKQDAAIELKKNAVSGIAKSLYDQQDYANALVYYDKLVTMAPNDANVYIAIYVVYVAMGDKQGGVDILEKGYNATNDATLKQQLDEAKKSNIKVGDIITLGSYEQDGNSSNGKEAIEWQVLAVENGKALLISRYGLEQKPYNTKWTSITWEKCSLRKWLNNDFYESAFTSGEKNRIVESYVTADKNPEYNINPGNSTYDNVFLLSINEANRYFGSDSSRMCTPTIHAKNNGVLTSSSNGCCRWWLRSPGSNASDAAAVRNDGRVHYFGSNVHGYGGIHSSGDVDFGGYAVRPALWINL